MLIAGVLLCLDTLVLLTRCHPNLGVLLPAILGLPLLLLGIFYTPMSAWFAGGFGRAVKWLLIGGYCFAVLFFSIMSAYLYSLGHRTAASGADAVLVLGAGIRGERVSLTLARRLDTALGYLEENPDALCFLSGGQGAGESIPEAQAMERYMLQRGLDPARIIKEDRSRSTQENFAFSYPLIRSRCGEGARVVYVTSSFHVCRAGRVAAAQGICAEGLGSPDLWYLAPNNYMRESIAFAVYLLRGWA